MLELYMYYLSQINLRGCYNSYAHFTNEEREIREFAQDHLPNEW